jgi:hypothetical protein
MSEKCKFHDPEGWYLVTCTVADWIGLFARKEFRHTDVNSLKHYQEKKGLDIHTWLDAFTFAYDYKCKR